MGGIHKIRHHDIYHTQQCITGDREKRHKREDGDKDMYMDEKTTSLAGR